MNYFFMVGAGGVAGELRRAFTMGLEHKRLESSKMIFLGYLADSEFAQPGARRHGGTVEGSLSDFIVGGWKGTVFVAVADPAFRQMISARLEAAEIPISPNIIHPDAITPFLGAYFRPEHAGLYIGAGAVVSGNTQFGDHVQIHNGAIIGHDVEIGHCSTILPGAIIGGHTVIGERVLVGSGATIIDRLKIGDGAIIGAGAVVIRDVAPNTTVVGNPAKEIATRAKN